MNPRRNLFGHMVATAAQTAQEEYYVIRASQISVISDVGYAIQQYVCQPLANGARIIAAHYQTKYGVDIRIVDHAAEVSAGDNLKLRFQAFRDTTLPSVQLEPGQSIAFILMHGTQHAVPFVLSREHDQTYMIIFDSNSGARKKGYYPIANLFPQFTVLLNNGTRQSDNGSCVTDALAITKDALRIAELGTYLMNYKRCELLNSPQATGFDNRPTQFFGEPLQQNNFFIFKMPEELLKSAQRSEFVIGADPDLERPITKRNETLFARRERDKVLVSFDGNGLIQTKVNGYLHKKSLRHADIIDRAVGRDGRRVARMEAEGNRLTAEGNVLRP